MSLWFKNHFSLCGFERVVEERTSEYNKFKKALGFYGYPDFLAFNNGKIVRVEIECFTSGYHHAPDYANVMLCYEDNINFKGPPEVLELKQLLGYEYIIADFEMIDYLLQTHKEFREAVDEGCMKSVAERIW